MSCFIQSLKSNRLRAFVVAGCCVSAVAVGVSVYIARLNSRIEEERAKVVAGARVDVDETRLRVPSTDGLTVYLNAADVRATALMGGTRYLATSGGLIVLDESGRVKRRYTTLDGLPDNDLTALAVFRDRLFVGSSTSGLMSFNGGEFTRYRFVRPAAARISVLAAGERELLIGTLDAGIIEYDGERFSRRFESASGADFTAVTALLPLQSRLYIGTQDRGLYIWREAQIDRITVADGLPSPHVTGLAAMPSGHADLGLVAVATDFGVVALSDANQIKQLSNRPNLTSLAVSGNKLWAGLFSGGVVDLSGELRSTGEASGRSRKTILPGGELPEAAVTSGLPRSVPATVCSADGLLWVLTREGAFVRGDRVTAPFFEPIAGALAGERLLTANHVTSLTIDGAGRLWVGYFDRGIDLISPDTGERLSHIEDDRAREINFIAPDPDNGQVFAATSRGVIIFGGGRSPTTPAADVLTREGGLINDSVAHVSISNGDLPAGGLRGRTMVLATAGGLSEIVGGRTRSLTAFHGLASNHLYSSAFVGSRLFVGSLAGLVELDGLRVVRTYKASNSPLSHDWVTSLLQAGGTLYVGTNGGGVDALLPTGEWLSFADEVGRFEVNQNAMHYDGQHLYVGSSDRGLLIYDTRNHRWTRITAALASNNVTAITSDGRFVYVGTLNGLTRIEKRVVE